MSWAPVKTAVRVGWGSTLAAFWIHWTAEYICEPSLTFGPSMLPTIPVADSWSLSLRRYKHGKGIKVGDVIEFERPTGPGTRAIKRVIGMPGDLVVVGPRMLEKDAASPPQRQSPENSAPQDLHPSRMIRVPAGHVWVVGDNLPESLDSRHWGPLPMGLIKGKVYGC